MLSSRAKYALRAVAHLAGRYADEAWVLAPEIAEAEEIPRKYLGFILIELRDNALLVSRRGRYGGYRLARPPADIAAADVIRIIDGPLALTPCASLTRYGACPDCISPDLCSLQPMLKRARDAVAKVLETYSIAQLAQVRQRRRSAPRPRA